jgi:hypothetical protein
LLWWTSLLWGDMVRLLTGAALALLLVASAGTAQAAFCKTLKGEWVGFGEGDARQEADSRLDKEIAAWRERYSLAAAKPKSRKTACSVYIQALNEYLSPAEAVVGRCGGSRPPRGQNEAQARANVTRARSAQAPGFPCALLTVR